MTPDEFAMWLENPLTQQVRAHFARRRAENVDTVMNSLARMAQENEGPPTRSVFYAGVNAGLNELLELSHEDLKED